MKRFHWFSKLSLMAVVTALLLLGCGSLRQETTIEAPTSEAPNDAVEAEVSTFLDRYLSVLASRDPVAIGSVYVDDGRFLWLEDGHLQYNSADDIAQALTALPPDVAVTTKLSDVRIHSLAPGLAWVGAGFATRMSGGSMDFAFEGVLSMVVERSGDNGWKIVSGHSSTDRSEADAFRTGNR